MSESLGLDMVLLLSGIVLCAIGIYNYANSKKASTILEACQGETPEEMEEMQFSKESNDTKRLLSMAGVVFGVILIFCAGANLLTSNETAKYTVFLDGNEVQIPCSYSDFERLGYIMDYNEGVHFIDPDETCMIYLSNSKGQKVKLYFENRKNSSRSARECTVIGITVNEESGPDFQLPTGVEIGMTYDEVTDIMGMGSSQYWSEVYTEQVKTTKYKISINYEKPVISVNSEMSNNTNIDFDSLTFYSVQSLGVRPVKSITVQVEN